MKIEQAVQLGRYTTLGAGGEARAFAKPSTVEEVEQALAWARERELPIVTIGLGSNLLVADEGVEALVLKLGGELASAEVRDDLLIAGGGAANACADGDEADECQDAAGSELVAGSAAESLRLGTERSSQHPTPETTTCTCRAPRRGRFRVPPVHHNIADSSRLHTSTVSRLPSR